MRCALLAREAGYDGVEIMGSEGYLLNQFLAPRTNKRTDAWGGTAEKRRRLPVEIVRRTSEAVGRDFVICYRMSMADYVDGGQTWDEIVALAIKVEAAGATIGVEPHAIGGADVAAEIDAKRAIRQGTELAARL